MNNTFIFKVNYSFMILGLGLDIVTISRITKIYKIKDQKFLARILTKNEIIQFNNFALDDKKESFIAKRFAAKEALAKAIGTGIGRIKFNEIEIYNNNNGKPEIKKNNKINELVKELFTVKDYQINLSLSDDSDIAQAIVILSKK